MAAVSDQRAAQLAANLRSLEERITRACDATGRARSAVSLIAVTKTFPAADVLALAGLGLRDFGENRDAEARDKARALAALDPPAPDLRWHFVGRLQRNKCRSVATYADVVHSVDRVEVARALDEGAHRADRYLDVMVQVSLDADPGRGGAEMAAVAAVADACATATRLRLTGVMAIAPLDADPGDAFSRLAGISAQVSAAHEGAHAISAGMSNDLEAALRHGATHLRVGTALLGHRTPPPG
ncbi:MAG: YggS family pyridoxal phosphate-dependent enzyme [Mycobacteriales bacterium]